VKAYLHVPHIGDDAEALRVACRAQGWNATTSGLQRLRGVLEAALAAEPAPEPA
jgi:hypothetical protein